MPDAPSARLVFAGTPGFALGSLSALLAADVVPLAVLTQPDLPAGRGRKIKMSPVKRLAIERGIAVWQPRTLDDSTIRAALREIRPDAIVVAAYGLLFPPEILALPRLGCINVHASLLPRWRGAAPIQAAILAGDRETGISLMAMEKGLDSGPVFAEARLTIGADETAGELHDRLALLGGELLVRHLEDLLTGRLPSVPQNEDEACYAPKIKPTDAWLDWRLPAVQLQRRVRAYNPSPGASFVCGGERVKCWRAAVVDAADAPPGTLLEAGRAGLDVACGEGALRLLELQRPGRGKVSGFEFHSQTRLDSNRFHP